jgi:hypothetical protein
LPTQPYFRCRSYRRAQVILSAGVAVSLSGCWTAPSASVRPPGEPRVIAPRIDVQGLADSAYVESVDRPGRTLVLSVNGIPLSYEVGRHVRHWDDVRIGDEVSATLEEELTVYVAPLVAPTAEKVGPPDAYVLLVDPSYRLLKLQYANGGTVTFKVRLRTQMEGIEAGDAVRMFPVEVTELHLRRHPNATSAG